MFLIIGDINDILSNEKVRRIHFFCVTYVEINIILNVKKRLLMPSKRQSNMLLNTAGQLKISTIG